MSIYEIKTDHDSLKIDLKHVIAVRYGYERLAVPYGVDPEYTEYKVCKVYFGSHRLEIPSDQADDFVVAWEKYNKRTGI